MTLAAPAVKFSIAGTRPIVCSAKNVTATPAELGSSTPTEAPSGGSIGLSLAPSTCAPTISFLYVSLVPSGSSIAGLPVSRVCRACDERFEQRLVDRRRQHRRIRHHVLQRRARR